MLNYTDTINFLDESQEPLYKIQSLYQIIRYDKALPLYCYEPQSHWDQYLRLDLYNEVLLLIYLNSIKLYPYLYKLS